LIDICFKTPDDGTGMVPNMPISVAAVRNVASEIRTRSREQTPEGRIAKKLLGKLGSSKSSAGQSPELETAPPVTEGVTAAGLSFVLAFLVRIRDAIQLREDMDREGGPRELGDDFD
jgi:hypothetical protein